MTELNAAIKTIVDAFIVELTALARQAAVEQIESAMRGIGFVAHAPTGARKR